MESFSTEPHTRQVDEPLHVHAQPVKWQHTGWQRRSNPWQHLEQGQWVVAPTLMEEAALRLLLATREEELHYEAASKSQNDSIAHSTSVVLAYLCRLVSFIFLRRRIYVRKRLLTISELKLGLVRRSTPWRKLEAIESGSPEN